ncbi:MAG: diaminopropionate ammonia-lyase [Tindallia sp. MSAO_Bac2]|nr:MAG: diaminopropionate ammonia-lyase [Tindallia sp. MSAO_Bac2]
MADSKSQIQWIRNDKTGKNSYKEELTTFLNPSHINHALQWLKQMEEYQETPLVYLKKLAGLMGVQDILIKDESHRFDLNAFKVLGGAYAVVRVLCERLGKEPEEVSLKELLSEDTRKKFGEILFVTATDGNHGHGLAWAANKLGHKAHIFMPKGSSLFRLKRIQKEGATAEITDLNYDDAVRYSQEYAEQNSGIVVQDTAWENYEKIPGWIMQGYAIMANEIIMEIEKDERKPPTHIMLQAGVGSFAAAIVGYFVEKYRENAPKFIIVEPDQADCYYRSAKINDGLPHAVGGDMNTIMAGLACGEPNLVGWKIINHYAAAYISCPDEIAARGMRILAAPLDGDEIIISGESGAVGVGLLSVIMENASLKELKDHLELDENARVLCINTEGDTDPEHYRKVVWDGKNPYEA